MGPSLAAFLTMRTLAVFTRDLRVHYHPAFAAAVRAGEVLPLVVPRPAAPWQVTNRSSFLIEAVHDGAAYFDRHHGRGHRPSNLGNSQLVAGTGANPRRGMAMDVERQARRFDPDERYRANYLHATGAR